VGPLRHRALDRRPEAAQPLASVGRLLLIVALAVAAPLACANPAEGDPRPPYSLRAALDSLAPQRPGRIDLYALLVGGDAEEVFRREVEAVRQVLDERLGTAGRSVAMVNDLTQPQPEVTLNSLAYALRALARRMDPEEDVLLLHLTSHGLRNHELSLRHPALPLYALSPLYLRSLLDEVGVHSRVVIVSACFSGGFVGPLSTSDTMVLTAASGDRPSYGCGSDSKMTDFSRALYLKALSRTRSLREAAVQTLDLVREDEKARGHSHSLPQLRSGQGIEDRLRLLERQLDAR
jgi:hypothetical protein